MRAAFETGMSLGGALERKRTVDRHLDLALNNEWKNLFLDRPRDVPFEFVRSDAKCRARDRQALQHHAHEIDRRDRSVLKGDIDEAALVGERAHVLLDVVTADDVEYDVDAASARLALDH